MLGIPVTEPEQATGRRGLCVVFTVFVSRRRVASPAMLVQMLASLDLAVAKACSSSYTSPSVTATILTQFLQRHNDESALDSVRRVTVELSLLFTSILRPPPRYYNRISPFSRRVDVVGSTFNNSSSSPYYAVCAQAAKRIRASRKGQLCYYLPLAPQMIGRRLRTGTTNTHSFLDEGIIVGQPFSRNVEKFMVKATTESTHE
jgi:hypothetical protein